MKLLIYGAGVIGCLYAALFSKAGYNTTIYARGKRLESLEKEGLLYWNGDEIHSANVTIINKLHKNDTYDYIFLTVRGNLEIGQETPMGQVYSEFQDYIKSQKDIGVMLNVNSKNEYDNAIAGLNHPDGSLHPDDFIIIKANWEPKSKNIVDIAGELNIMPDSLVFVDDNPAEREIIKSQVKGVSVPEIGTPEQYIRVLDHSGFFEVVSLSEDDRKRNEMYKANVQRKMQQQNFGNYREYLLSLEMQGTIKAFEPLYTATSSALPLLPITTETTPLSPNLSSSLPYRVI